MQAAKIIDHISGWLKNYIESTPLKGFVIGISGGIDSAVTSTLAAKTGYPLLVLEMSIHQKEDQVARGREHIQWLKENFPNVTDLRLDLSETFDVLSKEVKADPKQPMAELSLANTRSRLRMTTLYYYAGLHSYLVVGTGNKVEDFGVGFFTKYGDGGVDISPIADLLKSDVFLLAKELGIVSSIQNAKPTDGLWKDDRSDEDQMGATYPELEWAMEYLSKGKSENLSPREEEVLKIYQKLNKATAHKVNPIPVCKIPDNLR
ncbi:MAG: NAD(+) synthase [Flavobacteriaceae bacterium]|nr:MAG: NAD(+) synthase [Flavobacteriaceae bacterium]